MARAATLCLLSIISASLSTVHAEELTDTPVTRVVELLRALAQQVEKDFKEEESLYQDFVCWGKSIIKQKTASNAASESRINELETSIADLQAGRQELTTERADRERDIADLAEDLENTTAMRNRDHEDFMVAKDEMTAAIQAIEAAIDVLGDVTKAHNGSVLLAIRTRFGNAEKGGVAALTNQQALLHRAAELGGRFLEKADAKFLDHILLGEVPKVDWKKLNRKANFKMSYKARSVKIVSILNKMLDTFTENLQDAEKRDADALAEYKLLSDAKEKQLDSVRDALGAMEFEKSKRGMSLQESQEEVNALKEHIESDARFIEQTRKVLEEKANSWRVRSELRTGELAAINEAIHVLSNNHSRDVFEESFASQGNFLQVKQMMRKGRMHLSHKAAEALKDAALRSGDKRLLELASDLGKKASSSQQFDLVIRGIDTMLNTLHHEEDKDLDAKQTCEQDRMGATRDAIEMSRGIDDITSIITEESTTVSDCKRKLRELEAERSKTNATVEEARQNRAREHLAWVKANNDDEEAATIIQNAIDVLSRFYVAKDNDVALVQDARQPVQGMAAGAAPPPPPPTWEGGYGGKTGEAHGIIAILEMIREDILKDRRDAATDEESSEAEFKAFEADSLEHTKLLFQEEKRTGEDLGRARDARVNQEKQRRSVKRSLDNLLGTIKAVNPHCEYYEVNFKIRRRNRLIEIDGLTRTKAILSGGIFDEAVSNDREIKPGDAASAVFLQRYVLK